jgi:signal transduction histidine kinase
MVLAVTVLLVARAAGAQQPTLEAWRAEASRIRLLAENDAAQAETDVERLRAALPPDATPADRARLLNVLSRIEVYRGASRNAANHAREARALAEQAGDKVGQVEADLNLTVASVNDGRIEASYEATTHAVTLVDGIDRPDLLAEAMLQTAMMYQRRGQTEELVTTAQQVMEIARRSGLPLALAFAHRALGVAFQQSARPSEAREHFGYMLDAARAARSKSLQGDALVGLAANAATLGDLGAAERYVAEAMDLCREVGNPFTLNVSRFVLADLRRQQARHEEALSLLGEAVDSYERFSNPLALWWTLKLRSTVRLAVHQPAAAAADLQRVYALAEQADAPFYRAESAKLLAALAAERGDHKRAYEYLVEAGEMTARTASEGARARIMELTRRYESESKQREIVELGRREQQHEAELRHRDLQQRLLWTVIGFAGLALVGTAWFLVRLRRSHALLALANAELQRSDHQVRELNLDLERRVADRTAQLENANRELEAFAYSVSHDLRAPIRHIDGFVGLLTARSASALDESSRHYLDSISRAALRMGTLIDDLLAFARVGRSEMAWNPVDLATLVRDVIDDCGSEAQGRKVEWRVGELPVVHGQSALLRVALVNLVSNALKYTRPRERARIEIGRLPAEDHEVVVFIRDNGVGFDMKYASKLFGVFQRLHGSDEFEGTGIGLATVRRIVSRHGGRIWAESKLGEGSTFFFALPASPARSTAA